MLDVQNVLREGFDNGGIAGVDTGIDTALLNFTDDGSDPFDGFAEFETSFAAAASSSLRSQLFLDQLQIPRDLWNLTVQLFNDEILLNSSTYVQDGFVHEVYTFHPKAQCAMLIVLTCTTLIVNLSIVANVQRNEIKRRMANFTLISHLCTVDMLGAVFISPLPFWATWEGFWMHNEFVCMSSCVAVVAMWLQHILVFSLLKIDQVFAGWLPVGAYPAISADVATFVVLGIWAIAFGSSGLVVSVYGSIFEPAVMLCIPNLPPSFFITVFIIYCLIIASMVLGYAVVACIIWRHRLK
ncbi:unnamed protein product, partial [Notodromas monacha]